MTDFLATNPFAKSQIELGVQLLVAYLQLLDDKKKKILEDLNYLNTRHEQYKTLSEKMADVEKFIFEFKGTFKEFEHRLAQYEKELKTP